MSDESELLARVRHWFQNKEEALAWYQGAYLPSFGGMTPAEIVSRYGQKGIEELMEYIEAKELGSFE